MGKKNRKEENKSASRLQDHLDVCTPLFHIKDMKHSPTETHNVHAFKPIPSIMKISMTQKE